MLPASPSVPALRVARVNEVLKEIGEAYAEENRAALLRHFDSSFPQLSDFENTLDQDFKTFDLQLKMNLKRVEMRHDRIVTEVFWEGRWTKTADPSSTPLAQTGFVVMEWSLDESPRVFTMRGDIPWGAQALNTF